MTRKQSINRANFPRTVVGPGAFAIDLDEDVIVADATAGAITLTPPLTKGWYRMVCSTSLRTQSAPAAPFVDLPRREFEKLKTGAART